MSFGVELWHMLAVFFSAVFTGNILLTTFLGMCPFLAVSREVKSASGLGMAVIFVLTCTCVLDWVAYRYVLVPLEDEGTIARLRDALRELAGELRYPSRLLGDLVRSLQDGQRPTELEVLYPLAVDLDAAVMYYGKLVVEPEAIAGARAVHQHDRVASERQVAHRRTLDRQRIT